MFSMIDARSLVFDNKTQNMRIASSKLKKLRRSALVLGVSNVIVIILSTTLTVLVYRSCGKRFVLPFLVTLLVSCVRIVSMIYTGLAQQATAMAIVNSCANVSVVDSVIRQERLIKYRRWLRWTHFSTIITILQFVGAVYLMLTVTNYSTQDSTSRNCILGLGSKDIKWQYSLLVFLMTTVCSMALLQCFTGSDVLRWRSFFATEEDLWKAHYRELFDHGIRETLFCLGRGKYLTVFEEDEIYSVAHLLGNLVAYRASGTGHLELLAGLALLQGHSEPPMSYNETMDMVAPEEAIYEAAELHPFAEAAYTGVLLDFGRNPFTFTCAWFYRQGVLTPWKYSRLPVLEGDNWWRGHAAAFLKYVNLSPDTLRRGRVNKEKCKATYFVVVVHHLKSVVIAVRGTETPEDLITDGFGKECRLTAEDLDGLICAHHIQQSIRQKVVLSLPHHGHSGMVEAARDLYTHLEGNPNNDGNPSELGGFLSSLLGAGCECDGYSVRIVGHSLGGAIATLLGLRLYRRYPNLHVYAFGAPPCVDSVIADACSQFVTSIIHNNEFASRLSVASVMRLRAAALLALSKDATTNSTIIFKLARHFLFVSNCERKKPEEELPASDLHSKATTTNSSSCHINVSNKYDQEFTLWQDMTMENSFDVVNSIADPVSEFMEVVPSSENQSSESPTEMFLPGLLIHLVPENLSHIPLWKRWRNQEQRCPYKAYIANRESFKNIVVSSSMFLDHLPWRGLHTIKTILKWRNLQALQDGSLV